MGPDNSGALHKCVKVLLKIIKTIQEKIIMLLNKASVSFM